MIFKGVIFDFNGTLFWDTAFHDRAFDVFLEKHGVRLTNNEKRVKIHGQSNPDIMRGIFGSHLSDAQTEKMAQEKELIYRELCVNDLKFAPGAEDLFDYLQEHKIPINIATSAGIENVDFYFNKMNLAKWFDYDKVVYNNGTFRGKPFPDVFLKAAEKLHLHPSEIIIFEDSIPGIVAAEKAGAGKIYIVNSYNENYSQFLYDIITHFKDVNRDLFKLKVIP